MERLPVAIAAIQLPRPRNRSQLGEEKREKEGCSIDGRLRAGKKNGDSELILERTEAPPFFVLRFSKSCKSKRNEGMDNLWAVNVRIFLCSLYRDNFFRIFASLFREMRDLPISYSLVWQKIFFCIEFCPDLKGIRPSRMNRESTRRKGEANSVGNEKKRKYRPRFVTHSCGRIIDKSCLRNL